MTGGGAREGGSNTERIAEAMDGGDGAAPGTGGASSQGAHLQHTANETSAPKAKEHALAVKWLACK